MGMSRICLCLPASTMMSCSSERYSTWWIFLPSPIRQISSLSRSTQKRPSSVPTTILSWSMGAADKAFLITVTVLSITSLHRYTVLSGSLFFFNILCSSLSATTHLVFSDSESASMRHWCRIPGGSIRLVVTRKMHGMSFLFAWITSDSRTEDASNSESRMSRTCETATAGAAA